MLVLIVSISSSSFSTAIGEGNIDGGGGGVGKNKEGYYWSGADGVRVTVIRDGDNKAVTTPIDLTNSALSNVEIHFGKVSKIQYKSGTALTLSMGAYTYNIPKTLLPRIVPIQGDANIETIKRYFCSEYTLKVIADIIGFNYDNLISGEYKLLLEPLAYFNVGGVLTAATAHEAALYNQILGGDLRQNISSLSHKNLPLSMFLETSDLGFPAWEGPTTEKVSNNQIITSLGLGIVRFREADPPVSLETTDYVYRVDTDVISSITLSTDNRVTPDKAASVSFDIGDRTYTVSDIVMPEGESQVVWVKWHTPPTAQKMTITVRVNGNGSANINGVRDKTFTANVVDLKEKVPPNPTANDVKPNGYVLQPVPTKQQKTSASWGLWSAFWEPNWEWESDWDWDSDWEYDEASEKWIDNGSWVDNGKWVDNGDWIYECTNYTAGLTANMNVQPDGKVPTANNKTMRSGYGINMNVKTSLNSNAPSSSITAVQNVLSYYPEFNYNKYLRMLEKTKGGYSAEFDLRANEFSTYSARVHFTPIWFPDGRYEPIATVMDAWTPDGMLTCTLSDFLNISGNLYDDWHIAPK